MTIQHKDEQLSEGFDRAIDPERELGNNATIPSKDGVASITSDQHIDEIREAFEETCRDMHARDYLKPGTMEFTKYHDFRRGYKAATARYQEAARENEILVNTLLTTKNSEIDRYQAALREAKFQFNRIIENTSDAGSREVSISACTTINKLLVGKA